MRWVLGREAKTKIDDYNLSKVSNEAENFKEDVQNIINFGKYSSQVVSAGPTWKARNGEFVFFASGTIKRVYFYNLGAWDFIEYNVGATVNSIQGWICFSGTGTVEILDSLNVTSLTDHEVGLYSVTWDTDFVNANYAVAGMGQATAGEASAIITVSSQTVGVTQIYTTQHAGGAADYSKVYLMGIGA